MRQRKRINKCANCHTMLSANHNFCPNCGQENHYTDFSLKAMLNDFLGAFLNFDGKIWNTLKIMFLKPGRITKQYVQGKRIRYVSPIRLYLFSSFIFFFILNVSLKKVSQSDFAKKIYTLLHQVQRTEQLDITQAEYQKLKNADNKQIIAFVDSIFQHTQKWNTFEREAYYTLSQKDGFSDIRVAELPKDITTSKEEINTNEVSHYILLERKLEFDTIHIYNQKITLKQLKIVLEDPDKTEELIASEWGEVGYFKKRQIKSLLDTSGIFIFSTTSQQMDYIVMQTSKTLTMASYIMFLMMPFLSIFLFLLFRKKYKMYFVHLISTLHLHAFYYITCSLLLGLFFLFDVGLWSVIVFFLYILGFMVYFVISNKVLYGESLLRTLSKSVWLTVLYSFVSFFVGMLMGMFW